MSEETIWAVINTYDFRPVKVLKETPKTVVYEAKNYNGRICERRTHLAFAWRGTELEARAISQKLTSARAEVNQRKIAAEEAFKKRKAELLGLPHD